MPNKIYLKNDTFLGSNEFTDELRSVEPSIKGRDK